MTSFRGITHIYIAGPMRGYQHYNFPAFMEAEEYLRERGIPVVMNPAAVDLRKGFDPSRPLDDQPIPFDMSATLAADLDWICKQADAIYLLDGWENSGGARAERAAARALGLEIFTQVPPKHWQADMATEGYRLGYEDGYADGTEGRDNR